MLFLWFFVIFFFLLCSCRVLEAKLHGKPGRVGGYKKTGDGVRSAFKNMYLKTCHSLESFLEFRTDDDEICICTYIGGSSQPQQHEHSPHTIISISIDISTASLQCIPPAALDHRPQTNHKHRDPLHALKPVFHQSTLSVHDVFDEREAGLGRIHSLDTTSMRAAGRS